jgi:hypothetical protein
LSCLLLSVSMLSAEDWMMFGRDPQHSSHNSAEQTLTRENAGALTLSWTSRRGAPISAATTLVDGVLYYGAWDGQFYAVSAATGEFSGSNLLVWLRSPTPISAFPALV